MNDVHWLFWPLLTVKSEVVFIGDSGQMGVGDDDAVGEGRGLLEEIL